MLVAKASRGVARLPCRGEQGYPGCALHFAAILYNII
jgi:hypothetical protein